MPETSGQAKPASQATQANTGSTPGASDRRLTRREAFTLGFAQAMIIRGGANLADPVRFALSLTRQVDAFLIELDKPRGA